MPTNEQPKLTEIEILVFETWKSHVSSCFDSRRWDADLPPSNSPGMKEMERRFPDLSLSDIRSAISRGHAHALGIGEFYPTRDEELEQQLIDRGVVSMDG